MRSLLSTCFVLLALLGSACGGAQGVVEGVTRAQPFSVFDPSPSARALSQDRTFVLLSEEQGDRLALVSLELPALAGLPLGEAVDLNEAGVVIEASEGELEVIERSDGARVLNAQHPSFFPARSGTFTLDSRQPLAGSFDVELEDGSLTGSFLILN